MTKTKKKEEKEGKERKTKFIIIKREGMCATARAHRETNSIEKAKAAVE